MIWMIFSILFTSVCYTAVKKNNPMKMSLIMLMMVSFITLVLISVTGILWFNLLIYMLFLGGIMVLFLILTTNSPNENMMKIYFKNYKFIGMLLILFMLMEIFQFVSQTESKMMEIYSFISMNFNLVLISMIILLYLNIFTILMSSSSGSLRSIL